MSVWQWVLFGLLSPILLLLVLVVLASQWTYGLVLRLAVEVAWGTQGRRVLLVYSRSPVWQEYIEVNWLPRLKDIAIVLDWSDRANWRRRNSFAVCVYRHWAPSRDFNPMVLFFPRFGWTQRFGFYYAFRDWKHGKGRTLRETESLLFALLEGQPATHGSHLGS